MVVRLIAESFVHKTSEVRVAEASAPWATNDQSLIRRIMKVMTDTGFREDSSTMALADADELASCDDPSSSLS